MKSFTHIAAEQTSIKAVPVKNTATLARDEGEASSTKKLSTGYRKLLAVIEKELFS